MFTPRVDGLIGGFALVCACVLSAITITGAAAFAFPSLRARIVPQKSSSGYVVGETIDLPAEFYRSSDYTVVLFTRSTCAACVAAKPLFQTVVKRANGNSGVRILIATPKASSEEVAFAKEIGMPPQAVVAVGSQSLRIRTVPTIIVINQRGTILSIYHNDLHGGAVDEEANRLLGSLQRSVSKRS